MVKVKSSFGKVSGTKANTIYYEVNGVTFGRSKPTKMGNPKTEAQMKQRIKMNNILNTYKYIKGYLSNISCTVVSTVMISPFHVRAIVQQAFLVHCADAT